MSKLDLIEVKNILYSMYPKLGECSILEPIRDNYDSDVDLDDISNFNSGDNFSSNPLIIFIVDQAYNHYLLKNDLVNPSFSHLSKICEELTKIIPESKKFDYNTVIDIFDLVLISPYYFFFNMFLPLTNIVLDGGLINFNGNGAIIYFVLWITDCYKIKEPLDKETINILIAIFEKLQQLTINQKMINTKIVKQVINNQVSIEIMRKNRKELLIYAATIQKHKNATIQKYKSIETIFCFCGFSSQIKPVETKSAIKKFMQSAYSNRKDWLMRVSSFLSE